MSPPLVLLLLRGRAEAVRAWARKGLLPVWVVPGREWTLVVPAARARSAPPYDDPVALLGGRPLAGRLRPSVCLVADGQRAVVALQGAGRAQVQRWLVWTAGVGCTRVEGLPHAPVGLLAETAAPGAAVRERLEEALRADTRSGAQTIDDLLDALQLPGTGVLTARLDAGQLPDVVRVEPDERVVERFDAFIAHESRLQDELQDPRY